jgi:hypothetical protein
MARTQKVRGLRLNRRHESLGSGFPGDSKLVDEAGLSIGRPAGED